MRTLKLAEPQFAGNEQRYVQDCLDSTWISGTGPYVERFEEAWAAYCGAQYAVATCNGTAALHLALLACGVRPGDEVIVPDLTFAATANAVRHCRAKPVFCDVDPLTWTLDAEQTEDIISDQTKAVLPVHLYGHPADLSGLGQVVNDHLLDVVDDAAQAHGATYGKARVGSLTSATAWSFHAAKIITTGEGGMVTTNSPAIAQYIRLLRDHGMDPQRRYWHTVVGYNYRMTNLHAAIGLAQAERIDEIVAKRAQVIGWYRERLADSELQLPNEPDYATNVCWLFSVILPDYEKPGKVMAYLADAKIESRPFFYPLHTLPPFARNYAAEAFPVTRHLSTHGLSLPASAALSEEDVERICDTLCAARAMARSDD